MNKADELPHIHLQRYQTATYVGDGGVPAHKPMVHNTGPRWTMRQKAWRQKVLRRGMTLLRAERRTVHRNARRMCWAVQSARAATSQRFSRGTD